MTIKRCYLTRQPPPSVLFVLALLAIGTVVYLDRSSLHTLRRAHSFFQGIGVPYGRWGHTHSRDIAVQIKSQYLDVDFTEYQRLLRQQGFESTVVHDFKSPYVVDPNIYKSDVTVVKPPGRRPTRIISCYNCAQWFIDEFRSSYNRDIKTCPYSECVFDAKGDNLTQADVVMFFPGVSKMPPRPLGQIWAFCGWESPVHYEYPRPYSKWKNVFNWTINYRLNADIFISYDRLAWRSKDSLLPDSEYARIAKGKTKTAAWFVSNCRTPSRRMDYVKDMQKYIDVDIFGHCESKRCHPSVCLKALNDTYRFYLSFENSICQDYVTEKLFRNFAGRLHVIPVVRGGFDYDKYIPPNTFINANHFNTSKDLALYLRDLGHNMDNYSRMLKEKDALISLGRIDNWCPICLKLQVGLQPKRIDDVQKYSTENACKH